ncbi:TAXI family TRAP transporter solute-binding subunit [Vibrio sp. S4M6]|uniref:TAXI family TRAP transporter solute-binding subunit n=1 Tax=Vibrio sinus TaxID=2946865 RepID=UPI00202AB082|nr:TAXI family TRAP transporter solute-binding subunit [Vibrio sinus]MCL9780210.1 TAXI family TRAP transporter solute-binding subunit [Vibrio sinus]
MNSWLTNKGRSVLGIIAALLISPMVLADNYTIGTGSQSGTYYPLGGMLANVWSKNIPDFHMRAEVTAASVENVIKVAMNKQLVGIAMENVVMQAYEGKKPFPKAMNVSVLYALYPNVVQFIVPADSDITSIEQLKGKRISLGAPGSGTRVSAINILKALGIDEDDIKGQSLNYTATTNALANGQIDAGVIVGSLGVGAITELALTRHIRILSFSKQEMTKIVAAYPYYESIDVPAGVYKNVANFHAPAVWNVLVANKNMSNKMAYELTKVTFDNIDKIRASIGLPNISNVQELHQLTGFPLHPGAEKFIKEYKTEHTLSAVK